MAGVCRWFDLMFWDTFYGITGVDASVVEGNMCGMHEGGGGVIKHIRCGGINLISNTFFSNVAMVHMDEKVALDNSFSD